MKGDLCEQLSTGNNPFDSRSMKVLNINFKLNFNFDFEANEESKNSKKIILCNYAMSFYGPLKVFRLILNIFINEILESAVQVNK